MIKTMIMLFCFIGSSRADNIYLHNGYVHRNVRITNTDGSKILFMKHDSVQSSVRRGDVLRIEYMTFDPQSGYSFTVNDSLTAQRSNDRTALIILQTSSAPQHLNDIDTPTQPLIPSRHNAVRVRADWGNPAGMKFSAGVILSSLLAVDLFISNYGTWSQSRNVQRYGISVLLFTDFSVTPWHPVIPYFQIERGILPGGLIMGGGDNFSQIGAGLFMPIYQNVGLYLSQSLVQSRTFRHTTLDGTAVGVEIHFSD